MPALAKEPATAAPLFIGLQSYTEAQAPIFFGRDEEIQRLTNLIKANTLTIVFGKSGTGKTSLLNAGVFPRLRKEYCLPFRIRLEFNDDSPGLVQQISNTLKEEIDKYGFKVESYPGSETLWEYFHREQLWKSVTPILIFDQFEEIFTLGRRSTRFGKEELDAFWQELADLIENSIPERIKDRYLDGKESLDFAYKVQKIKALFSFREEFLPEFESITAKIPSLKYSRFRLLPMNGHQAYEVITKTWKGAIDKAEADKIVRFFSSEEGKDQPYELMTIEPSLLSQVCSLIEKERLQEGKEKISSEFLDQHSKSFILRSIYNEAMTESNGAVLAGADGAALASKPMNEFAEDKLITDEGYRTKYMLTGKDERFRPGIAVLRSKYFIRDEGKSIELTHDVLTPLIKHDREERRKELAIAVTRKKARRRAAIIVLSALLTAFVFWLIAFIETGKAISEKELAKKETEEWKAKSDSIRTQNKIDSTNAANNLKNPKQTDTVWINKDSAGLADFQERNQRDSLQILSLKDSLNAQKRAGQDKDSSHIAFTVNTKRRFDSTTRDAGNAKWKIDSLQRHLTLVSRQLTLKQKQYDELGKNYTNMYAAYADYMPTPKQNFPFDTAADTHSLRVKLSQGAKRAEVPDNLIVYLIPDSAANKKIIKRASVYEPHFDDSFLNNAKGRKIARYHDGSYVFLNVEPGAYFVRVSTYCGGYKRLTKKTDGNETFEMDASPPIR